MFVALMPRDLEQNHDANRGQHERGGFEQIQHNVEQRRVRVFDQIQCDVEPNTHDYGDRSPNPRAGINEFAHRYDS